MFDVLSAYQDIEPNPQPEAISTKEDKAMTKTTPKRVQQNPQLVIHYDNNYEEYPVTTGHGPLIGNYLGRLKETIEKARSFNEETFVTRFDLHFPLTYHENAAENDNRILTAFWDCLNHQTDLSLLDYGRYIRYAWARELGEDNRPCYRILLMISAKSVSDIRDRLVTSTATDNLVDLRTCIAIAWSVTLGCSPADSINAVHFLYDPSTNDFFQKVINRHDEESWQQLFKDVSHICKKATKPFGQNLHTFECSIY